MYVAYSVWKWGLANVELTYAFFKKEYKVKINDTVYTTTLSLLITFTVSLIL